MSINDLDLVNHSNGTISLDGDNFFLPVSELKLLGCSNCVWKSNGQCPSGYVGTECNDIGYCDEFVKFLLSFQQRS